MEHGRPVKVVLAGGSGQVGALLARDFHNLGHEVVVLSRREIQVPWRSTIWDGRSLGRWTDELENAHVVVNLAGRSVNCRYTARNRLEILKSRVDATRAIGAAIAQTRRPPAVWLQASTATIYAHRYDADNDEASGQLGGSEAGAPQTWRFSIDVARAWERAADEAHTPATRKIKMRSAMVMSPDAGGIFDTLLRLVRFGLGGRAGDGRQFVSWIHETDFVRAVRWLIENRSLEGAVNLAAPIPLPYADFMGTLRKAWGMPVGLPASRWMLEAGAFFLRTETELVLKSRRVAPGRLLHSGFEFTYPAWPAAADELCGRWRRMRRRRRRHS